MTLTVERRALVIYRAILGGQGRERRKEDGTVVRRGVSAKVRERLTTANERRLTGEILIRRVRHLTQGTLFGGRAFIDGWFETHRERFQGRSRTERKRGAKSLGSPGMRGLYALRSPAAESRAEQKYKQDTPVNSATFNPALSC